MAYDGKYLAEARRELNNIRESNEAEAERRRSKVFSKSDDLRLLDSKIRSQMTQIIQLTLSSNDDAGKSIDQIRQNNAELQAEKAFLLTSLGYTADYLDPVYSCPLCKDSGNYHGGLCTCLRKIYNRKVTESLSSLLLTGNESFDRFDLTLYSSLYDPKINSSPSECMSLVYRKCKEFASDFPLKGKNLLMQGGTGLGKTFLSACIAREVSEKGFSVCYETSSSALSVFERQIFSRDSGEIAEASEKVRRELDCDLLIIDDLGTELITTISINSLYTLINTRIIQGKSTIISTNYSDEILLGKYGEQIASRLTGLYEKLPFFGTDIRKIKRMK